MAIFGLVIKMFPPNTFHLSTSIGGQLHGCLTFPVRAPQWGWSQMLFFKKKDFICLFLERGKGGRKRRETLTWERNLGWLPLVCPERNIGWLPLVVGTKPHNQACALTGNRTSNLWLCGMTSNQLSHTGQGKPNTLVRTVPAHLQLHVYIRNIQTFREFLYIWAKLRLYTGEHDLRFSPE